MRQVVSGKKLSITKVLDQKVTAYAEFNGMRYADDQPGAHVAFEPKFARPVVATVRTGKLHLHDVTYMRDIPFVDGEHPVDEVSSIDGRIYVKFGSLISELVLMESKGTIVPGMRECRTVWPNSTRLWPGMATENMLGSTFLSLFPKAGFTYTCRVKELDGYTIIVARSHKNVAVVVASKGGKTHRFTFKFDDMFFSYDVSIVPDVPFALANFVVLDSGTVALINEKEELELFLAKKGAGAVRVIEDPVLGADMSLTTVNGRAGFTRPDGVYSMTLV